MIKAKCQLLGLVQLEVARPDHAPPAIGLWLRCSNPGNQTLSDPPTVRKCRNWEIFSDDNMRKIIFPAVFQALCSMQCLFHPHNNLKSITTSNLQMWKLGLPASRESWQSCVHPGLNSPSYSDCRSPLSSQGFSSGSPGL